MHPHHQRFTKEDGSVDYSAYHKECVAKTRSVIAIPLLATGGLTQQMINQLAEYLRQQIAHPDDIWSVQLEADDLHLSLDYYDYDETNNYRLDVQSLGDDPDAEDRGDSIDMTLHVTMSDKGEVAALLDGTLRDLIKNRYGFDLPTIVESV